MFFHDGVFAVKGYGMKVQVEGRTSCESKTAQGIDPSRHEYRIGCRINPAAVFRKEGFFGILFRPVKRVSPSPMTSLMTWFERALPKSFRASRDRMAWLAGICVIGLGASPALELETGELRR